MTTKLITIKRNKYAEAETLLANTITQHNKYKRKKGRQNDNLSEEQHSPSNSEDRFAGIVASSTSSGEGLPDARNRRKEQPSRHGRDGVPVILNHGPRNGAKRAWQLGGSGCGGGKWRGRWRWWWVGEVGGMEDCGLESVDRRHGFTERAKIAPMDFLVFGRQR